MRPATDDRDHARAMLSSGLSLALALIEVAESYDSIAALHTLETVAARCAAIGVPVDSVHEMVHEGVESATGALEENQLSSAVLAHVSHLLHSSVTHAYRARPTGTAPIPDTTGKYPVRPHRAIPVQRHE